MLMMHLKEILDDVSDVLDGVADIDMDDSGDNLSDKGDAKNSLANSVTNTSSQLVVSTTEGALQEKEETESGLTHE